VPKKKKNRTTQFICLIAAAFATVFFTFGEQGMSAVDNIAPWLLTLAVLFLVVVIVFNEIVWDWIKQQKRKSLRVIIPVGMAVLLCVPTFLYSRHIVVQQAETRENTPVFYGTLTPNNEATPFLNIPQGDIALEFDNNLTIVTSQSNGYIFSQGNNPFLTISIKPNGDMMLSTKVTDSEGNVVVDIVNNRFQANQNYAFFPLHPNHYTFSVNDLSGTEVLSVDYINPKVMRITGNFGISGYSQPVVISSTGITFPNGHTLSGSGDNTIIDITKSPNGFLDFQ